MTLLITGARGFVAQGLLKRCLREGCEVTLSSRSEEVPVPGARVVGVGALDAEADWRTALDGNEVVIHTAARVHMMGGGVGQTLADYRTTNVEGTLHLAEQAAAAGVRRFVFLSSVKVNGEETVSGAPFTADDVPAPQDPYGISKHEAELGLREIGARAGMEVTIVRPPLVYGPNVKANFATLIKLVRSGVPLPLGAVRGNKRSLVALDNLVDFILTCSTHDAAANQTFLVSDDEDVSTADLIRRMKAAANASGVMIPVPPKVLELAGRAVGKGDMIQRLIGSLQVDISKSKDLLGWSPVIGLDEGLLRAMGCKAGIGPL